MCTGELNVAGISENQETLFIELACTNVVSELRRLSIEKDPVNVNAA